MVHLNSPYVVWGLRMVGMGGFFSILMLVVILETKEDSGRAHTTTHTGDSVRSDNNNNNNNNNNDKKQPSFDPKAPRIPHSLHDHIYYSSFDGVRVYDNRELTGGATARRPLRLESRMFNQMQEEAVRYLKEHKLAAYTPDQCSDVRYRAVPTVGVEVDVLCRNPSSSSWTEVDRVTLLQPLAQPQVILHTRPTATPTPRAAINIVVPLLGRSAAFQLFLDNVRRIMGAEDIQEGTGDKKSTQNDLQLGLTVVYFEDGESEAARALLETATAKIPGLVTDFLLLPPQKFSRSLGLKYGTENSKVEAPVVFLCDTDVLFTRGFLERCLATPVRGSQVFFPMVFSQYNPELVYPIYGRKVPPPLDTMKVEDHGGYWRVWGHGMSCMYKSDFLAINGLDPHKTGWGGEDLNLLGKTAGKRYKIVRSLDYGLFHHYHPKNCSEAGKGQSWPCAKLRAMSEASSMSFGLWFFRHQYTSSSWGMMTKDEKWEARARPEDERAREEGEEEEEEEKGLVGLAGSKGFQQSALVVMILLNVILIASHCWTPVSFGRRRLKSVH